MKMATATENRQYISIIDNDKISKSKAMQNLNNNNPVGNASWSVASNGRRSRNDSINYPGWLHNSITDDLPTSLDCILNDCMWNISDEGICKSEIGEFDALIGSFNSESDPINSNSTSTFSVSGGVQRRDTKPDVAEISAAHLAASSSLPPSPTSTCTSGESESASYALSILDDLEPLSVEDVDRYFTESLDVAQLHRIFTSPRRSGSGDSALWNDEITVPMSNHEQRPIDVRPKATAVPPVRRPLGAAMRPRADFGTLKTMLTPQRTLKRPATAIATDDYAAASKMRRTVAATAARLGCAMSGGAIDCEVVIREDEHEAIEQVEVEYEVSGDVETDYEQVPLPARVAVTPRLLPIRGAPGRVQPRAPPGTMQPLRAGVAKLQRTASGNLMGMNSRLAYGNLGAQRAASFGPQTINRASAFASASFNRQTFGPGRMPLSMNHGQDSPYSLAGRLPGRPPKRMSLPSAVSGSSTQSDAESSVSMNAPRRGSSSYCSQMERNRRREMNTALAALRRLILEDDRSLLSKVYAKSQLNRRNTSMIMTLRAAHDTVLKLNEAARRTLEERNEQARRRERLLKRLQQLQATQQPQSQQTHVQPAAHMTLLSAKSDWSV